MRVIMRDDHYVHGQECCYDCTHSKKPLDDDCGCPKRDDPRMNCEDCSDNGPCLDFKSSIMKEHIIILEERGGSFYRQSHIVPKRVYDAINVLINPTREGLTVEEQENSDNTS